MTNLYKDMRTSNSPRRTKIIRKVTFPKDIHSCGSSAFYYNVNELSRNAYFQEPLMYEALTEAFISFF